ncbi:MAG: putative flavoprotein involved in transport [Microbacteriaceae bacterium]|nr:putative flavoprotein involved in transport [Microbacteriaceae bacterium]
MDTNGDIIRDIDIDIDIDVIVIGGGQAGLSVSHHLAERGIEHLVLDAAAHIGDAWRNRWDSLRLFTPARYDGLDGMDFPGKKDAWPTKDDMADFLQAYAARFALPVRSGMRVESLTRHGDGFVVRCETATFTAHQVIVAMSNYQVPRVPAFADGLDQGICQLAAGAYRNPGQLAPGRTLIVGAGNSGAEIAKDLAATHDVVLAGTSTGEIPFASTSFVNRHLVVHILNRFVFTRILSVDTAIGRKARPAVMTHGVPLIRVKMKELAALGVTRAGRLAGVTGGMPTLEDGTTIEVANIVWCTGFSPGFSWIRMPILDARGEPEHDRGIVPSAPGLYFIGLHFLTSMASAMVHGVGRDAERIADEVERKMGATVRRQRVVSTPAPGAWTP